MVQWSAKTIILGVRLAEKVKNHCSIVLNLELNLTRNVELTLNQSFLRWLGVCFKFRSE